MFQYFFLHNFSSKALNCKIQNGALIHELNVSCFSWSVFSMLFDILTTDHQYVLEMFWSLLEKGKMYKKY